MGNHTDTHHSEEKKPVAFIVPLLFGLFVISAILWFVSLGDNDPSAHHGHNNHHNDANAHSKTEHVDATEHNAVVKHDTTEAVHESGHDSTVVK